MVHPNDVARNVMRFRVVAGVRKGEAERGYTILIRTIKIMVALIAAIDGAVSDALETPRGGASKALSRVVTVSAWKSFLYSHYGKI